MMWCVMQTFSRISGLGHGAAAGGRASGLHRPARGRIAIALFATPSLADPARCTAEQAQPLIPTDPALCQSLLAAVRDPSALPLDQYEAKLNQFFGNYCHRDTASGWRRDKHVRDAGPFTATLADGAWQGKGFGTHTPVVIWYSPDMADWLVEHRSGETAGTEPAAAGAGRGDHGQGDVPVSGRRLRRCRSGQAATRPPAPRS